MQESNWPIMLQQHNAHDHYSCGCKSRALGNVYIRIGLNGTSVMVTEGWFLVSDGLISVSETADYGFSFSFNVAGGTYC